MRKAFINTLIQVAKTDSNLYLLTADMGYGLVEPFAEKFPKQYINVGVAEQNMIGVATGLALDGKRVFCYSIGNFPTMRCLEQIRNDVCYHNLPVCLVSGGAGLWYGNLGMTHWAVEDIAVMRVLPNMTILSPCNASEMRGLVEGIHEYNSPCYLRMTRETEPSDNEMFPSNEKPEGSIFSVVIIATGTLAYDAVNAVSILAGYDIQASVINVRVLKPLNQQTILDAIQNARLVITIEEHSRIGGLGSAVAEVLAGMKQHPPLVRLGTGDEYPDRAMSYEELLKFHHLDVDGIVKEVLDALR
jgi:transketolase